MDMPGTSSDGTVGPASSPPSPSSGLQRVDHYLRPSEAEPEQNEDESGLFGSTFDEPAPSPHDPAGISSDPKKTPTCTTSIVRDMPLPKQFSGKTPQSLLDETLRRIDKFAQPQYLVTSRGRRSIRASVEIKWSNRKLIPTQAGKFSNTSSKISPQVQTFTMEDEACRDETKRTTSSPP
ncbi:hypothetical protein Pst134EA_023105 [Puccinia striiformis f. sp. tritici]|uniref:hypothetical protein n=1 Tax=Puccinia striiformis f. sp. tritici TaxID=168172 RepID=UPI002008C415|nr:hypothetical protein Pst134EA_023105 [Puccinia striiformis f. sp. tritici]KAH9455646.1 hypothetical protein Pst134EA_023105 [Puccinia striiformis f. sp. tritici]